MPFVFKSSAETMMILVTNLSLAEQIKVIRIEGQAQVWVMKRGRLTQLTGRKMLGLWNYPMALPIRASTLYVQVSNFTVNILLTDFLS